ncbi:bromodomain-containing protein 4-like [Ylistrum balloti]|uniref:bromodomain-containing protein 4-like n=1 Tax=Ylistrum balloti TaxID=509963 RepID=UPI002905DA8E|nr:bromodomain-containing protein 4-like [Ylistrum balloti]
MLQSLGESDDDFDEYDPYGLNQLVKNPFGGDLGPEVFPDHTFQSDASGAPVFEKVLEEGDGANEDPFEYIPPTHHLEQSVVPNSAPPLRERIHPTHDYQTLPRYTRSNFKPLPILKDTKTSSMAMGGSGYQIKPGGKVVKPPPPYSMDDFMQKMKANAKKKKKKVTKKRRQMKARTAPLDDNVDVYMGHARQTPLPSKIHTPIDFEMSRIPSESPPPYASPQPKGSNSGSSRGPGDSESIENVSQSSQSPPTAISFLAAKPLQDFPPVVRPKEAFMKSPTVTPSVPSSSQRVASFSSQRQTTSPTSQTQPRIKSSRAPSPFLYMRDKPEREPIDIDVDTDSTYGIEEIDNPAFDGDGGGISPSQPFLEQGKRNSPESEA